MSTLQKNAKTPPPIDPETIQTSMSLYSDKLCAVVLLVNTAGKAFDTSISSLFEGSMDKFERNGCEFQFLPLEQQKELSLKLSLKKNDEKREACLKVGDFFVTKHSNLSQVHIVFNLVALNETNDTADPPSPLDKTLKQSELSSRHPVIMGIRNVLKVCVANNVQTLTFPLLLTHEMTEVGNIYSKFRLILKRLKLFMV